MTKNKKKKKKKKAGRGWFQQSKNKQQAFVTREKRNSFWSLQSQELELPESKKKSRQGGGVLFVCLSFVRFFVFGARRGSPGSVVSYKSDLFFSHRP